MAYIVGDLITVSVMITDAAGAAVDPPKLHFCYKDPEGGPAAGQKGSSTNPYIFGTDSEIVKDSTGHYHIDLAATMDGDWLYYWRGLSATDQARGADEGGYHVEASKFF